MQPSGPPGGSFTPMSPPVPMTPDPGRPLAPAIRGGDVAIGLVGSFFAGYLFIQFGGYLADYFAAGAIVIGLILFYSGTAATLAVLAARLGRKGFMVGIVIGASIVVLLVGGCAFLIFVIFAGY